MHDSHTQWRFSVVYSTLFQATLFHTINLSWCEQVPRVVWCIHLVDSEFTPSQWETTLHCNDVSHWLGTSLEPALFQLSVLPRIINTQQCFISKESVDEMSSHALGVHFRWCCFNKHIGRKSIRQWPPLFIYKRNWQHTYFATNYKARWDM